MSARELLQIKGYRKSATVLLLAVALVFSLFASPLSVAAYPAGNEAAARIRAGLLASAEEIDLSGLGLTPSATAAVYTAVLEDDPALFHVAPRLSYAHREGVVTAVYPAYTLTGAALTEARAFYREAVASLLAEMDAVFEGHPHTEAETVLYLHDALAVRYAYDTRSTEAGHTAYDLFREGRGVCQAYAMACLALFRAAGLEADFVASAAMDHAWVHVRADGAWYHVDVTRDDPIPAPDGKTYVMHSRILRSDAGLAVLGYRGFACPAGSGGIHAAADARYEAPTGEAVLATFWQALTPVSVGAGRPLLWLGIDRHGAPRGARFSEDGARVYAAGDLDGDGRLSAGDALVGEEGTARDWVRKAVCRPTDET